MQNLFSFLINPDDIAFQTVSHLKVVMNIATAVLVGLMYGDSGINATKSVANIGLLLIGVAYLWYTTLMPSVLKCKLISIGAIS